MFAELIIDIIQTLDHSRVCLVMLMAFSVVPKSSSGDCILGSDVASQDIKHLIKLIRALQTHVVTACIQYSQASYQCVLSSTLKKPELFFFFKVHLLHTFVYTARVCDRSREEGVLCAWFTITFSLQHTVTDWNLIACQVPSPCRYHITLQSFQLFNSNWA